MSKQSPTAESVKERQRQLRAQLAELGPCPTGRVRWQRWQAQRERILTEALSTVDPWLDRMAYTYSRVHPQLFADLRQEAATVFTEAFATWDPDRGALLTWLSLHVRRPLISVTLAAERPALKHWDYGMLRKVRRLREAEPNIKPAQVCERLSISKEYLVRLDMVPEYLLDDYHALSTAVDDSARATRLKEALDEAIAELEPHYQQVLTLLFEHSLTLAAAAEQVGVDVRTVARYRDAALSRLRDNPSLVLIAQ